MPVGFVVRVKNVFQRRNARGTESEAKGAVHKNSRRRSWLRFWSRRWFLALTCYCSVAFTQACLQELEISLESSDNVLLSCRCTFPRHVVLEVQRNGALKTTRCQRIRKIFPIHHAFSQGTVSGRPAGRCFLPSKVLRGDHFQARHHQIRCDLPPAHSAFGHGMTCVEVEASPLRIKRVDDRRHVPNRCSDVLFVIMVTGLDSILFAKAHETPELTSRRFKFTPHIDHLILVITRLEEWNRKLGRRREDCARCRVVR